MKNIRLIFIVFIIVSCKSETAKSSNTLEHAIESVEMKVEEKLVEKNTENNTTFLYKNMTTEKLQEFLDLIALQNKHPEFSEEIKSQLKNYTKDSLSNYKTIEDVLIKNIELQGAIIKLNDTIEKMKITFDLISKNDIKQDSIWAEVTTHVVELNGKQMQSRKVRLNKIK